MLLEAGISKWEGAASVIIDKIIEARSLAVLESLTRTFLSRYFALQLVRTPWFRTKLLRDRDQIREKCSAMGYDPDEVAGIPKADQESTRLAEIQLTLSCDRYRPFFENRPWLLCAGPADHPFVISDNPVGVYHYGEGPAGLGYGAELYIPISAHLTIAMRDPINVERKLQGAGDDISDIDGLSAIISNGNVLLEAVRSGTPTFIEDASVETLNLLQVYWAKRFVFSSQDDFGAVERLNAARHREQRTHD